MHPGLADLAGEEGLSFTCPRCGRTTHHPEDVRQRYCGSCHDWLDPEDDWETEDSAHD